MRFFGLCVAFMMTGACGTQSAGTPARPADSLALPSSVPTQVDGPAIDVIAHVLTWHEKSAARNDWGRASTIPWRSDGNGIGYRSEDLTIINQQVVEMQQYGITPLLSWHGADSDLGGDSFLDVWRSVVTGLPAAILYEGEARLRRDRDKWWTVDSSNNAQILRNDLTHLYERYWAPQPDIWYRRNGKFVVYLWPGHAMRGDLRSVLSTLPFRDRLYVVTTEFNALRLPDESRMGMLAGIDAVTGYGFYGKLLMESYSADPSTGKVPLSDELIARYRNASLAWQEYLAMHLPQVDLILPLELAFDDRLMPYRDNPVYEATPEQATKLIADIRDIIGRYWATCGNVVPAVTIPSYNEHYEGTALEPNDRFGTQWIEMVEQAFARTKLPASRCE